MTLHLVDYIVFSCALVISAGVGVAYFLLDQKKLKEKLPLNQSESYFLANRKLRFWPTTVSLYASFVSAVALVGIPAEFYEYGAGFLIYCAAIAIGASLAALLIVPVLYELQLLSIFTYIELRFKSKALRRIGSINGVFCTIFYLSAVTLSPCVALEAVSPIPMWASVLSISIITIFYSVFGGMKAIVMVDLIQAIFMLGGVISAIIVGFSKIEGGIVRAFEIAREGGRLNVFNWNPDPRESYSVYALLFPTILANCGLYATAQGSVQRYSSLRNVKLAMWSVLTVIPQLITITVVLFLLSIAMYAHYADKGCDPVKGKLVDNSNQLATYYITEIMDKAWPGIVGLWFSAIFSGSLSSMSTGYNSISALVWDDFLKGVPMFQRNAAIVHKVVSAMAGLLVMAFAILFKYIRGSTIRLVLATSTIFESAMYIPFFCGIFMPWTNTIGVSSGMITSSLIMVTLSLGQILGLGRNDFNLPLSSKTTNCSIEVTDVLTNVTLNAETTIQPGSWTMLNDLFTITSFHYALIEIVIGCGIACIISLATGGWNSMRKVIPATVAPFCRGLIENKLWESDHKRIRKLPISESNEPKRTCIQQLDVTKMKNFKKVYF